MNTIKICLIIPSVSAGGIETYVLRFLRFLPNLQMITVLVRSTQKGSLYEEYIGTGVRLVFMPLGYLSPIKLRQHYRFYKKENFDVLCDFSANFAGWVMYLAKKAGISKRITFYRQSSHHFKPNLCRLKYANFLNHLVYKSATQILSNSQAALDFFFEDKQSGDARFKVVKNGVNLTDYQSNQSQAEARNLIGLDPKRYIIGHTGRFAPAKNHFFLLKVIQQYSKDMPNDLFVLVGQATEKLKPYIAEMGIEKQVQIAGFQKDIPTYLRAFDAYVFPSVTEGQPNALIEAMVSGVPIACSNINPILECLPQKSDHCTFHPQGVDEAVAVLKQIKKERVHYQFAAHAEENFDAQKQFLEFKNILSS